MFASTVRRLSKLALFTVALAAPVASVQAQTGDRASFVIQNPTSVAIHYQVKWGDGPWTSFTVDPRAERFHSHPLDFDNRAPVPLVRFDYICDDGPAVTNREYRMDFYAVYDPFAGCPYFFRHSPDGRLLDLYKK